MAETGGIAEGPKEGPKGPARPLPAAEAPFDAIGLARMLLRTIRSGALATIDGEGMPFASLVTIATDADGTPLMLLSRLSAHTRNLLADPRCSLLFSQGGKGDPLAHPRLTVNGRATQTAEPRIRERFLARHPKAKLYADFPDFAFFALAPEAGHLNGGFAKAATLTPAELLLDPRKLTIKEVEIGILAVVMDHEARNAVHHGLDPGLIPFAQTAERACRVGEVKAAGGKARVQSQAALDLGGLIVEPLQLTD